LASQGSRGWGRERGSVFKITSMHQERRGRGEQEKAQGGQLKGKTERRPAKEGWEVKNKKSDRPLLGVGDIKLTHWGKRAPWQRKLQN